MGKYIFWILFLISLLSCSGRTTSLSDGGYDVVVYGGTAAGVVAAVTAAREGLKVALLEPGVHLGGMVSGGLGASDVSTGKIIGGYCQEFFSRIGKKYGSQGLILYFEPHVAEEVFSEWLAEAGVNVFLQQRIASVNKEGNRIASLQMEKGDVFAAKIFIDASYEGDILPRADVSYTWGREGGARYQEPLAGRQERSYFHQFDVPVSAYSSTGNLLPLVLGYDSGLPGTEDRKVQAYNFRLCLTDRKENQVAFHLPSGYDPGKYELLRRYLVQKGNSVRMRDLFIISPLPNGKFDINNLGPISTDFIGGSWEYPEANYQRRDQIREEHKRYIQGLLYYLGNDPAVPLSLREEVGRWGLAKDEFVDSGNWPHQLYVREARRMVGEYVMTQTDLQTITTKQDSIGMGGYSIDSHHVQRVVGSDGNVVNEGDVQVTVPPYEISYRSLVPKKIEVENLLVPVCMSASHIAYSSIRMEPQYMIMAHAAGEAAYLAIRNGVAVQDIDVAELQHRLLSRGQIISLRGYPMPTGSIIINNGADTTVSARVTLSLSSIAVGGTATSMQFSKDGLMWFELEPFSTTRTATLLPGDGVKTIFVRFIDKDGLMSPIYSDTVMLDTTAPSGAIIINNGDETTSSTAVSLNLTASDTGSAVVAMQLSKDGTTWFPWEPFSTTRQITLTGDFGRKAIYVRFRDAVSNVSPVYSATITYSP